MVVKQFGSKYVLWFKKDELVVDELLSFVRRYNVQAAWLQGIGGAQWVELGFYNLGEKQYHWEKLEQSLEIVNLTGNIAWQNDKPVLHLHGTFGDSSYRTYAGHVKDIMVAGTCEILVDVIEGTSFSRSYNEEVGLNLLDL